MKTEIFEYGNFYHVYNRGNNHENIFYEERNYFYFLKLIKKHLLHIAEVHCFCLLKNHFHLIIKIKEKEEIDSKYHDKIHQPFSNLFNAYTKSINKAYDRNGSLFQEHLKRIKIEDEKYLLNLTLYIHLNPIKHKISKTFKDYPYSSYKIFFSKNESSLVKEYIFSLFDGIENFEFQHDESKIVYEGIVKQIDEFDY